VREQVADLNLLTVLFASFVVFGSPRQAIASATETVTPQMSTETIQRHIWTANFGATILFEPGKYTITKELEIPCKNLTITGPESTPPVVTLASTYQGHTILTMPAGCPKLGSIRYIEFQNTGAVYVGENSADFRFEHNLVTRLPSQHGGDYTVTESGVFLDGSLWPMTTTRHVTISDNVFGDASSCTAVFATDVDEGGYCAGVITHTGLNEDLKIVRNSFNHLEEGIHLLQLATYKPGDPNSGCIGCVVEYNSVVNYHRIGIEIQVHTRDTMLVRHNDLVDPLGAYYGTFAVSLACCLSGPIQGFPGYSPSLFFDDNVLIASIPGHQCPPYGVEFWGEGAQGTNSLVEGLFCNGYTWGYGSAPWAIKDNYICGPNFATGGGYISNQQHQSNPPLQTGNVTNNKCSARSSTEPVISPLSKTFTRSEVITLSDPGPNTTIWYTTNGSEPVPGATTANLYTQPFTITKSTVVKAVAMWGSPNQPAKYPQSYGYIPSRVVTASFVLKTASN